MGGNSAAQFYGALSFRGAAFTMVMPVTGALLVLVPAVSPMSFTWVWEGAGIAPRYRSMSE